MGDTNGLNWENLAKAIRAACIRKAYLQGGHSYADGCPVSLAPFRRNAELAQAWIEGWNAMKKELGDAD